MILVGVATDDASVALLLVINVLLYDEHYGVVAVVFTYSGLVKE